MCIYHVCADAREGKEDVRSPDAGLIQESCDSPNMGAGNQIQTSGKAESKHSITESPLQLPGDL